MSCKSRWAAIDFLNWKSPSYIFLTPITESVSIAVDVTTPILPHNLIMVSHTPYHAIVPIDWLVIACHRKQLSSLPRNLLWYEHMMIVSLVYLELDMAPSLSPCGNHSGNAFTALSDMIVTIPCACWLSFCTECITLCPDLSFIIPGVHISKTPETFRACKAIAKSRALHLQSCFIHIFLILVVSIGKLSAVIEV